MARLQDEFQQLGHMPTFRVSKNQDGWMAQCNEIEGIIAGGSNPDPSSSEIEVQIRDSIFAAFNIEVRENPFFTYKVSEEQTPLLSR